MVLNKVKSQVEYILNKYPQSRDSDKILQVLILKEFYGVKNIDDILNPKVPSLESIRRCRQKLQSEGKYKSSKSVYSTRLQLEETYRQFAVTKE
ncbi:hypothetical protein ACLD43_18650 [Clostridium botulinum]|uniref:hypothetical protein n=1 Tax=Clostridium botulinum TaxID=1491 RepID=UPI001D85537A|nr:hypothetical protein [Clostridium botulinum]